MSWLKPEAHQGDYNPHEKVTAFLRENGQMGKLVLEAFNTVDPLGVYYGEETNPDEYLGYAQRFLEGLKASREKSSSDQSVEELVRGSFHERQIAEGHVTPEIIRSISEGITTWMRAIEEKKEKPD